MIEVQDLTKIYNGKVAVDQISFEVGKGEIVGFLGPNGAGKSTTMRILTGFLSATGGSASVAGFDVYRESLEARRRIGYMPESVPLYADMRVKEYLHFRAHLKGMRGHAMRRRIGDVMDLCGLVDVRRKLIGALSKGYRQRVGLADALSNKPDLLILDEPTNGLDPNQIRQVRGLIKNLGENHTILLSTHILSEVEMTCGRVIIIDGGKIKASDSPENLVHRIESSGTITVEMKGPSNHLQKRLRGIEGVKNVTAVSKEDDWMTLELRLNGRNEIRDQIYELSVAEKWPIRQLSKRSASLEDVFVDLTSTTKRG
tara:strand:- start:386 stop:1327 length:942 start_codon:yes stop_codon:yes gene_type:complete